MNRPGLVLSHDDIVDLWRSGDISNSAFNEYMNRLREITPAKAEDDEWGIFGAYVDRAVVGAALVLLLALLAYVLGGWWGA